MRFNHIILKLTYVFMAMLFCVGCSDDNGIDNREHDYGFVRFKLVKKQSRANELDYLRDAHKITVTFRHDMESFNQTLLVEQANAEVSEYGLHTETIKLLAGDYEVIGYTVYNAVDERILSDKPEEQMLISVIPAKMTLQELPIKVTPRGKVHFKLVKDLPDVTRAIIDETRTYTLDEVRYATINLSHTRTGEQIKAKNLECKFVRDDYGSSYLDCDTLIEAIAGDYRLEDYTLYNKEQQILTFVNAKADKIIYKVEDNTNSEFDVAVTISRSADYINDYVYLKQIWEAMDGPNWKWVGDAAPAGSNWNFDRDVDLWGDQPGVMLHSNGRVAALNLGGFNPKGDVPECLGELSELTQLWLGDHTDDSREDIGRPEEYNSAYYSSWARAVKGENRADYRWSLAKEEMQALHNNNLPEIAQHPSEPIAAIWAQRRHEGYKDNHELVKTRTYEMLDLGFMANRITSLPKSIGKLKKLEALYVANGLVETLPEEIGQCEALTDVEIYNCNKMTKFPDALAKLPQLTSLNFSGNGKIPGDELKRGLTVLFDGKGKEKLQILYLAFDQLEEFPENGKNLKMLGLLDLAGNKLKKIHSFGQGVSLVKLFLDDNQLTEIPSDFFKMDDCESFTATNNKLTSFPNIFTSDTPYYIGMVDFSYNNISSFEGYDASSMELSPDKNGKVFQGINATTVKMEGNKLKGGFPAVFTLSNSDVANFDFTNNELDSIGAKGLKGLHFTASLALGGNHISKVPEISTDFNLGLEMPYLDGVDLSCNHFEEFPNDLFAPQGISKFFFSSQIGILNPGTDKEISYKCFKKWPEGIEKYKSLRELRMDGNDIRLITTFPVLLNVLTIAGNENISMVIPDEICTLIQQGRFMLLYEPWQKGITGCPALGIEN